MASMGVSKRFIKDVRAAKSTAIKKSTAKSEPKGICWNTTGSVMNISGGPLATSRPKANTAGITTIPARRAAHVSKKATFLAHFTISTSFLR